MNKIERDQLEKLLQIRDELMVILIQVKEVGLKSKVGIKK